MELERQMFGKDMFVGPFLTMGHREGCEQAGLARLLSIPQEFMLNYSYLR